MPQISFPTKSAFCQRSVLGQVPNVLTYPQNRNLFATPNPPNDSTGELTSTFQRALFLKLYLEYGFIAPLSDIVLSECERQYPQQWEALRAFGKSGAAHPKQQFETLKRMADEVHHLLEASGVPLEMPNRVQQ